MDGYTLRSLMPGVVPQSVLFCVMKMESGLNFVFDMISLMDERKGQADLRKACVIRPPEVRLDGSGRAEELHVSYGTVLWVPDKSYTHPSIYLYKQPCGIRPTTSNT
ncbi:hypothetical protein L249_2804 [Ophiocordyceps polyrhachis-furcata BCC 54312]|uniref:Uncharacterized protein n=1 Tax=Ophiocordyceps polyrhachis-furcata BCC 54312 TaxID=1330021 RepID=A0A367LP71_9HYPO|nr:hypothetical protein L249_2804 [Ophiocordyceps polyrhachis-furcata BCC 54312]